mmetsp:Transcript_20370/g.42769  ORF Transcript_20370/g.42769 Transcript_20370/m.42769 type:complete len:248 (+) Transcript_20370:3030-3773(+)
MAERNSVEILSLSLSFFPFLFPAFFLLSAPNSRRFCISFDSSSSLSPSLSFPFLRDFFSLFLRKFCRCLRSNSMAVETSADAVSQISSKFSSLFSSSCLFSAFSSAVSDSSSSRSSPSSSPSFSVAIVDSSICDSSICDSISDSSIIDSRPSLKVVPSPPDPVESSSSIELLTPRGVLGIEDAFNCFDSFSHGRNSLLAAWLDSSMALLELAITTCCCSSPVFFLIVVVPTLTSSPYLLTRRAFFPK